MWICSLGRMPEECLASTFFLRVDVLSHLDHSRDRELTPCPDQSFSLLDSFDWGTVLQNKSNAVPCNFYFYLSISCFGSNQNKANNHTNPQMVAKYITTKTSCLFCSDSSHLGAEHPHILHLTLLAAENVSVYWKALPLGWGTCWDTFPSYTP